ncbi:formate dehydrogenase subunit alpha [Pontibaca methylaminivorans]|uniref:Formate dehydrogenase alpha subunit n=1 Tax=Pontibaca methylaminivorans TaxID=515897 RepID=A0A1R3WH53_9RHOB|nr:formate dehydrogenase subunit alpha [Pontibaca methylaminivorans]SIT75853.1 formate dehydrogenase alpha subunit [Pontibaca methylaminivorans]
MRDFILPDHDFGTPASKSTTMVTLTIDGESVSVPEGTSLMRAAAEAGVDIPRLCATDSLDAWGSCRMCLVEIDGRRGTPASCTTPAAEGLVVHTQTPRLKQLRRGVMELYVSDYPQERMTSPSDGDCKLHAMAAQVGLREVRYKAPESGGMTTHYEPQTADGKPNPQFLEVDTSNPYFQYDPAKCIACDLCVRACNDIQGTFALSMNGRGWDARMQPGMLDDNFLSSECVSCGACVQACPTGSLTEKSVLEIGLPNRTVLTTCAYCGVGCTFKAELLGDELVRMVPYKHGKANEGHSCVKGRFAYGYANHQDRILKPMIRDSYEEPWKEVSWDEAIGFAATRLREIQDKYGRKSAGVLTSSRCTNEETYLVQKFARAVLRNNNTDTCARVCHSPTGYGLGKTFGTSAGTQDFVSIDDTDVVLLIGANPAAAHPVFASRMKKRLREGAKLIVVDPRRSETMDGPHYDAVHHLALRPGTNVAVITAMAHVIATEGLYNEAFIRERCDWDEFQDYLEFVSDAANSPEAVEAMSRVPAGEIRAAARLYATGGNASIYYGLGVTEHAQGSTAVIAIANLAMLTGNIGRPGVGVNPLRGQNNVQGSCDMGSFPHELPGYRHVKNKDVREIYERAWGVPIDPEPGLRVTNMLDAAVDGTFKALYCQGEDIMQSDPDSQHVAAGLKAMELVIVHDLFLNETANFANVFLPGSSFLEKDGTFTNAERRINMVRQVMAPQSGYADWEVTQMLANAMGAEWTYTHPSEIMAEIAATTPSFAGVTYERLDELGSVQWPCNDEAPEGTPIVHVDGFVRGKGKFIRTGYVPSEEKANRRFPLLLTTGRILSQYNVGAQTRRTANMVWHGEDVLQIHPHDAEDRGIRHGDWVRMNSRAGETTLRAEVTDVVAPGVVYTTFHHPFNQVNVVTTDSSDWATNCPEYKVTAVQVAPSNGPTDWQEEQEELTRMSRRIVTAAE